MNQKVKINPLDVGFERNDFMKSGTGFFLAIGTGLGVGLYSGNSWLWQWLIGAVIITLLHIFTKSVLLMDYVDNCKKGNTNFSLGMFFIMTLVSNITIIGVTFALVRFFMR